MASLANFPSMFGDFRTYHEPEMPETIRTPSQRRAWRKYVAYDRKNHEAVLARYDAEHKEGESFTDWCWNQIMDVSPTSTVCPVVTLAR